VVSAARFLTVTTFSTVAALLLLPVHITNDFKGSLKDSGWMTSSSDQ